MGSSPLTDILYMVAHAALYPVIVILLLLVLLTLVLVAMTCVEYFTERRHFQVVVPDFLRSLEQADCQSIPQIIATSGLIKRQKTALMTLFNARDLPSEACWNTAKRSVYEFSEHYRTGVNVAETTAKVAPMLGLMGTLIPLGPGIQALGESNMAELAGSLIVAFDTTVVGLISAAVCLLVARVRRRWSNDYLNALEAMQSTLFDKTEELRESGDLDYVAPSFALEDEDAGSEGGEGSSDGSASVEEPDGKGAKKRKRAKAKAAKGADDDAE